MLCILRFSSQYIVWLSPYLCIWYIHFYDVEKSRNFCPRITRKAVLDEVARVLEGLKEIGARTLDAAADGVKIGRGVKLAHDGGAELVRNGARKEQIDAALDF